MHSHPEPPTMPDDAPADLAVEGRRRLLPADELRRIRDDWVWAARNGIGPCEGDPPLAAAEVAVIFGLARSHCHAILRRYARLTLGILPDERHRLISDHFGRCVRCCVAAEALGDALEASLRESRSELATIV